MAAEVFILDPWKNVIFPGERHTRQYGWVNVGSITAVVAAGQAPIDVDKRADADVEALAAAKKALFLATNGTVAIEIRLRADGANNDAYEIQLYAEAGTDHYTKIADLTCTQGTQDGDAAEHFIDTISEANKDWLTTPRVVDAQAEHIARYVLNVHGYTKFLFVCTDLKSATNIYIDARRF